LRALQRRCSSGGRPRDGRSDFGDARRFCSDVAEVAAGEVSDAVDVLRRADCRVSVIFDDERVTTALTHQSETTANILNSAGRTDYTFLHVKDSTRSAAAWFGRHGMPPPTSNDL